MTEKNNSDFFSSRAHVSPYNIHEAKPQPFGGWDFSRATEYTGVSRGGLVLPKGVEKNCTAVLAVQKGQIYM